MAKINQDIRILTLSISLLVIPAFAQQEKPPESFDDAMIAFMKADYKSAADQFRQAIAERPSMVKAHYYLGLSLYNQQNFGEALSAYQELVRLDPDNILAHYQLAKIHLTSEDFRQAVEEYQWLASISKRRSETAVASGDLLPDKPGGAINDWQKQQAGELAQYLLDMFPRSIGDQYELPASQTVYSVPSSALSCLKGASQQSAAADSNQKRLSPAPGDLSLTPQTARIIARDRQSVSTEPASPVRRDHNSATVPMTASLRPTILYREKAKYTEVARINKSQGTVVLSVVFSIEGKVTDILVVRCLPDGLMQSAITAAQKVRFNPAIKDGTPVSVRGQLEFS